MLHATDLLGGEAYDRDGHFVGQVTELFIEPADQPNRVARVLLGRGKFLPLIVRYDHIAFVAPGVIRLNVEEKDLAAYAEARAFPIIPCDLCGSQEQLQRKQVKAMLAEWEKKSPGRMESIFSALASVAPSHLLDRALHDFMSLALDPETPTTFPIRVSK